MKLRLCCLLLLCGSVVFAKDNKDLIAAKFYYDHSIYYKAIPYFEKVADQLNDPVIWAELADCYSVTDELPKAASAYAKAVSSPACAKPVVLRYAQILMQLQQYAEAEKQLKVYQASSPGDKRISNLIAGCESAMKKTGDIPDGVATLLDLNTNGSEFAPTIWKGQLVFACDTDVDTKKKTDHWTGRSYYNIFSVTCDNSGHCGNEFRKIGGARGVNIKYHDGPATFSADGKKMYFTRSRSADKFFGSKSLTNKDSLVVLEIMVASDYDTADKKFRTVEPFQYNDEAYAVEHPSVSPNGKVLMFSSNMPKGHGGNDLYLCKKVGSMWSKPQNAGATVNTEGDEVFPYWADDSTLFFSSDGHEGLGGLDIYKSHWDEKSNTFSAPENIGEPINSSYDDISLALYADGRNTYFSSNRPAARSSDNIYFYKKERIYLQLTVLDSLTSQPIVGAQLAVEGKAAKPGSSDVQGQYFSRLYPEEHYKIGVSKDGYQSAGVSVLALGTKDVDTIYRTVKLYKPVPIPKRDTIPPLYVRNPNVMDTPGIREFVLGQLYELGHFYYDLDKYDLKATHKVILDTLLTQMNRHPSMRIQIRAHTDCRGTYEHNQVLSKNRALSVVNYLVEHGIKKERLEYIGLGNSMPTIPCPDCNSCTEDQHMLNRLLEFKVLQL